MLVPVVAAAQDTGSLELFQPAVAGDALFGVPSASIGGHLQPRAEVVFDYAYQPLSISDGTSDFAIVSHQLFLHLNLSLPLFDKVLLSADMPFALYQAGDSPTVAGVNFASPSSAEVSDLRVGGRVRFFGEDWDPFQLGLGGYLFLPTGSGDNYAAEGAVRGLPQLLLGGRGEAFVYNLAAGAMFTAADHPHSFDLGVGGALVLADQAVQLGPEFILRVPFERDVLADTPTVTITSSSQVSAEVLLGGKFRPLDWLVLGAAAGPGLTQGWGTAVVRAVGSVGYAPLPERPAQDRDGDGIKDGSDACPAVAGVASDDPDKHGCPPAPKKVEVEVKPDGDGDGFPDVEDACPKQPGVASEDAAQHGCPPKPADRDDDGIVDKEDACPTEPGVASDDPTKNGCPRVVVTATAIVINGQVHFRFGRSELGQTVDPISNDLMIEVRDAIDQHPEIELIEVQGHADSTGPEDFNEVISLARANAVRNWLIKRGVAPEKLIAKGYGSSQPRASNSSPRGRQKNRRVELIIRLRKKPDAEP